MALSIRPVQLPIFPAMLKTSIRNALENFFALHSKVADENETVIVTGGPRTDVAWIDARELARLRARAARRQVRDLTRVCVALEQAERRLPSSEEILREIEG